MTNINYYYEELIINTSRILILLSKFEESKKYKLTLNRIVLLDFYLKFPEIMLDITIDKENFYSKNAYFHWKPDIVKYSKWLNFLVGKKLIERKVVERNFVYIITGMGKEALNQYTTNYSIELNTNAEVIKKLCSNQSEKYLETNIEEKLSNKRDEDFIDGK